MAHSVLTYNGAAGFGPYVANFTLGTLRDEYVLARVNNEVDGLGDPVYRTLNWITDTMVMITSGAQPTGADTVSLIRTMPVDLLIHDYVDGAVINAVNLNESNLQLIMLVQQFLDGRIEAPLTVNLNMGGFRVTNMAQAVDNNDAVTLAQMASAIEGVIAGNATGRVKIDGADTFGYLGEKIVGDGATIDFNKVGDQLVASYTGIIPPLDNTTASTDPTINDDANDGYSAGSRWFNLSTNEIYLCMSSTVGAAVWIDITFNQEDIAPLLAAKEDKVLTVQSYNSTTVPALTLSAVDLNKVTHWDGAPAKTLTLPNISVGANATFVRSGSGALNIVGDTGITVLVPTGFAARVRAQHSEVFMYQVSATQWKVVGDLEYA